MEETSCDLALDEENGKQRFNTSERREARRHDILILHLLP